MSVNFGGYEIARTGMYVNERGLDVTGHNISNVNTPGFVRQQAVISSHPSRIEYAKYGINQYGLGSDIEQIRHIRDIFLDNILRKENSTDGYWEMRNKTMMDIQAIMREPIEEGLQDIMNQFWNSWQELSKQPESLTVRSVVRQRANSMVQYMNKMGSQLERLQEELNMEIESNIEEVNKIISEIANINTKILKSEYSGDVANDYRDKRDLLIDKLSKFMNIDITEVSDGQIIVQTDGYAIVNKGKWLKLKADKPEPGAAYYVPVIEEINMPLTLKSGMLKGLMESRGEVAGVAGSYENGIPNTKADIVFAVDISSTSAGYLANVKANVSSCVNELKSRGIDYDLRLITYGDNVISNTRYGKDDVSLSAAIPDVPVADTGNNFGGAGGVLEGLEGIADFREGANRFAMVFTGESIDGDGGAVTDPSGYIDRLNDIGMNVSVITDISYYENGNPPGEAGWDTISESTGGDLYDINTPGFQYSSMMTEMGTDVNKLVNKEITYIEDSLNIIPELKSRMNAFFNIMFREINYMHKNGMTLEEPPSPGKDIFVAVNNSLPLCMGNVKLNDSIESLNNIAASKNGNPGDNRNALDMADLRNTPMLEDATGMLNLDEYYNAIVMRISQTGEQSRTFYDNQHKLLQSVELERQSISGVSMDEEMTNLMKYKFAYNASAKVLNTIDNMIERIIEKTGITGR
jgi:flagellar hook-associated protein 1